MRYCCDTWFILFLFDNDPKAVAILKNTKEGKDRLIIPIITYAETIKKLFQRGISKEKILLFFESVEASQKIRLVCPDKRIAEEAARLSLTYAIPLLDSFVAATAKVMECDVLLAADSDYNLLEKKRYLKIQSW